MITKQRIEELRAMGFARCGTYSYPEVVNGRYVQAYDQKNYPLRSKISVKNFGGGYLGHPIINDNPIGYHKLKKLFGNVWFDTPEEAWEAADWFVNNWLLTDDIKILAKEHEKLEKRKQAIEKEIRKIRKSNAGRLEYLVNQWQFKEKF